MKQCRGQNEAFLLQNILAGRGVMGTKKGYLKGSAMKLHNKNASLDQFPDLGIPGNLIQNATSAVSIYENTLSSFSPNYL